jgi:hypothetical protein
VATEQPSRGDDDGEHEPPDRRGHRGDGELAGVAVRQVGGVEDAGALAAGAPGRREDLGEDSTLPGGRIVPAQTSSSSPAFQKRWATPAPKEADSPGPANRSAPPSST